MGQAHGLCLPKDVTIATVKDELPGIQAHASRRGWDVRWEPDALRLIFMGMHPADRTPLDLIAAVDGSLTCSPECTTAFGCSLLTCHCLCDKAIPRPANRAIRSPQRFEDSPGELTLSFSCMRDCQVR